MMDFELYYPNNADVFTSESVLFSASIKGKLDISNTRDIYIIFKSLIDGGAKKIIFNAGPLDYIDSSGIGMLVNIAKNIRNNGGDIAIVGTNEEILKIFKLVNLQNFLKMFDTEEQAINHFFDN